MSGALDDFDSLFDAMARLNGRLREAFGPTFLMDDLGNMERIVLLAVVGASDPPTVPRIGRSLGHPRQVIQRAANQLVGQGLIEARPNPDHKRASLLVATPAGQALHRASRAVAEEIAEQLDGVIDRQAIVTAVQLLNRIRHDLEKNKDASPA